MPEYRPAVLAEGVISPIQSAVNGFVYPHKHPHRQRWQDMAEDIELALKYVTNWGCAVDAGAQVGHWTVRMAKKFTKVHAFEPWQWNYHCLRVNCMAFDNIVGYCMALGKEPGKVCMVAGDAQIARVDFEEKGFTPMVALDSFDLSPGFLKIDVEGLEIDVLKGAEATINRSGPVIMCEHKYTDPTQLLKRWGYRIVEQTDLDRVYVR